MTAKPEVLAPAGDFETLKAAVNAGADAVYFGMQGFNARARATNFSVDGLSGTMNFLHEHGVKGYVTLNTLIFENEIPQMAELIRACAHANVDAIIAQDLAVCLISKHIAPSLPVHASTQMTCTDVDSVAFAKELGIKRVVLARELSINEIAAIKQAVSIEVEVFVHGAMCIAYSGQCLTSEAIGGRSANRGACAQSCRLPYELIVDGTDYPLGDKAYLLSPSDLVADEHVEGLAKIGVSALKIEGRLKGASYVGATTQLYRHAVDALLDTSISREQLARERSVALQTYSRGSTSGFLDGIDHQRLVEGRHPDHVGLFIGDVLSVRPYQRHMRLEIKTSLDLNLGDGLIIEGGFAGQGELGGRIWHMRKGKDDVQSAKSGDTVLIWLGPDKKISAAMVGHRVFRNDAPNLEKEVLHRITQHPQKVPLQMELTAQISCPLTLRGRTGTADWVTVQSTDCLEYAHSIGFSEQIAQEKLSRLGDSPFVLQSLSCAIDRNVLVPMSWLNQLRRTLVDKLAEQMIGRTPISPMPKDSDSVRALLDQFSLNERAYPRGGLYVLCRNREQVLAAVENGVDGIIVDFLELTGTGQIIRELKAQGIHVTVAPPRIRKNNEEKIDEFLFGLAPDAVLVRSLGTLRKVQSTDSPSMEFIGDFSLNITNPLSARYVLSKKLAAFTPAFDLDSAQLFSMLDESLAPYAEVVVHHPMPLFHMEHCVIAATLSKGKDHLSCGRPCEHHQLSIRDRKGHVHPIEADVGCRNTVFHSSAQSAASLIPKLLQQGVRRFRIELVRENAADVGRIVDTYRKLIAGVLTPEDSWRQLKTDLHYGVVRGSLRVLEQNNGRP